MFITALYIDAHLIISQFLLTLKGSALVMVYNGDVKMNKPNFCKTLFDV